MKKYVRRWLNKDTSLGFGGHMLWSVETEGKGENHFINTSLSIADCNKVINLDVEMYNEKRFNNTINKINTIIEELESFKHHMYKAYYEAKHEKAKAKK